MSTRQGHFSAARSGMLKALGYRGHIQRKNPPGKPLRECQKGRNRRIAITRAKLEHAFGQARPCQWTSKGHDGNELNGHLLEHQSACPLHSRSGRCVLQGLNIK